MTKKSAKASKVGRSAATGRFVQKDGHTSKARKASRIVVRVHQKALRELEKH